MASVSSQLIEEVTVHAQSDSLEDAREICADGTYFPNNQRTISKQLAYLLVSLNACLSEGPNDTQLQSVEVLQGQFIKWLLRCFHVTSGSSAFAAIPICRESGPTRFSSLYCS